MRTKNESSFSITSAKLYAIALVHALFASFQFAHADPVADTPGDRPNVLFIAVDDLNTWIGALGGHPQVKTPNIDRLAARGVLFTNAHCAAPACNPSRTSVMTGLRPSTSGVYSNRQDWRKSTRLKNTVTLPEHFKSNHYKVLGGGKLYHAASLSVRSHTGLLDAEPWDAYFPSKDRQLPKEVVPEQFPANGSKEFYNGFFDWAPLEIDDAEMGDGKVVAWAEDQLSQQHTQPLFLAVGLYRPHIPWYTPKPYFDLYPIEDIELPATKDGDLDDVPEAGRAMARRHWHQWMKDEGKWREGVQAYLASVSFVDAMVGRLLHALDSGPMRDNTIVVLWSDHGYHLGHKEHWEKFALWEQATRVPLIVAAPGLEKGKRCGRPVSLIDLYPTLSELCRLEAPPQLEGKVLTPWLKNAQAPSDRAVVTTQGKGNHAVRSEHWRYIRYADGSQELYDHRHDPNEFTNLASLPESAPVIQAHAAELPKQEAAMDPPARKKNSPASMAVVSLAKDRKLAVYSLDAARGTLRHEHSLDVEGSPGAMCVNRAGTVLFVTLKDKGTIASYRITPEKELLPLSETVIGAGASYLVLHPSEGYLLSSYYTAGKVAVHRVDKKGILATAPTQHIATDEKAHAMVLDPSGKFAFVPHTRPDAIFQFSFDTKSGLLKPNETPKLFREAGSGPRHLWFHQNGRLAYGSDEKNCSITAYQMDPASGALTVSQTLSSLPEGPMPDRKSTSDIEVHPSGKFVYIANRGHDTIAAFAIDPGNGSLTPVHHVATETTTRSFNITPDGSHLIAAGQRSGKLAVFKIGSSGKLTRTSTIDAGQSPWWVQTLTPPSP